MTLSPKQKAAVERSGQDVCVVAGPGSGKTRVLVERFCWLVSARGVSPLRVLAITFTEKAATEIKQRLVNAFSGDAKVREQIERAYVSTIHGFCARLLRENSVAAGLDPGFIVMDAPASAAELDHAADAALERLYTERPSEFRGLLDASYFSTDLASCLIHVYHAQRVAGVPLARGRDASPPAESLSGIVQELYDLLSRVPPPKTTPQIGRITSIKGWLERAGTLERKPLGAEHFRLLKDFKCDLNAFKPGPDREAARDLRKRRIPRLQALLATEYYERFRALLVEAIERIDEAYRSRKRELSALDFSDLEEHTIRLLEGNPEVRDSLRKSFDYILMDELQDTNPLQWKIVNLIRSPERFFAVGDINQSIYGFRQAAPEAFREYRKGIESARWKVDELDENYRSRQAILSAAECVLADAPGIELRELKAKRQFCRKTEPSVEVIVACAAKPADPADVEARWIARRIRELEGKLKIGSLNDPRAARFRDFAILVRANTALPPIERAFKEFDVPYLTTGGQTFYEAREVRDLVLLLRAIDNPRDEIALAGVLRSPLGGVADETLLRMKSHDRLGTVLRRLDHLDLSSFDAGDLERLRGFRDLLNRLRSVRDDVPPDRLLLDAIDGSGYGSQLDGRARANVDKLLALVCDWHCAQPRPVNELVEDLEWIREAATEADAPPDDSSNAVRVMSIHQAKGLEFPVVLLAALHRHTNDTQPSLCLAPEGRLGVRWRNPAGSGYVDDVFHVESMALTDAREREEEDRLLYVAMTRAEEHLVLSFARTDRPGARAERVAGAFGIDLQQTDAGPRVFAPVGAHFEVRLFRAAGPPEAVEMRERDFSLPVEELLVPHGAASGQHDSSASVTAILAFEQCPHRYFLDRYLGWSGVPRPAAGGGYESQSVREELDEPDAAEFGLQVHALLAGAAIELPGAEAVELKARFDAGPLGCRVRRADRIEREFDFLLAVDDIVLHGQIDLWFEENGRLVLVDYKTNDIRDEDAHPRADDYALQLRLYALALERVCGRLPDEAYVCFLRPGRSVSVDLSEAALAAARGSVGRFREAQNKLSFPLREGRQCRWCPFYRGLCPAGRGQAAKDAGLPSSFQERS